ncbi:hypothetical protein TNCV_5038641 [Trichonephila clavipes]|nr:hypothetical protein TNCV_5038641 [Trichonephila clavipes]
MPVLSTASDRGPLRPSRVLRVIILNPSIPYSANSQLDLEERSTQVALKLQRRMRTGIWQLLSKETNGTQHQTCLARSLQLLVRQFQGRS